MSDFDFDSVADIIGGVVEINPWWILVVVIPLIIFIVYLIVK